MTKTIPEKKARQGGWGFHGFAILIAALLLTAIAWGIAELYGEQSKTPATEESGSSTVPSGLNPAENDPVKSKTDNINVEPVGTNPQVDKNPTQSSTGGDRPGTQPAQPAVP
ncbi:hypothetical protein LHFGNBLO_005869 [Mesorhizobium sp. AR10]|uniref:hypothetical protein n=1 Tax=Mesorhizobium sp. AR10 TaxID=2865839 RepID=UPI002160B98E|nr:hypothetical protein [Mesorhizobium sp. AR10]UVK38664.1 hypothetical protein LHFGNBLO_005869 [Mesorhizobium sp. AR10]